MIIDQSLTLLHNADDNRPIISDEYERTPYGVIYYTNPLTKT